jgi:hypothetical protein
MDNEYLGKYSTHETAPITLSVQCKPESTALTNTITKELKINFLQHDSSNNFEFKPFTCKHSICCSDVSYTCSKTNSLANPESFDTDVFRTISQTSSTKRLELDLKRPGDFTFYIHATNNYDNSR